MARNSSGTYTLPTPGVPFQSGTTISSANMNATLTDLANEITSSADRGGRGGFTAPVRGVDGTVAAPAVSFTSEPGDGMYRAGAGDLRLAVGGVDALKLASGGVVGPLNMPTTAAVVATGANASVQIQGNRNAADAASDVSIGPTNLRTAGFLLQIFNNIVRLNIDYLGLLRLDAGAVAAAIQPASLWTAITPNANWTAGSGLAYWKTSDGVVHLKGTIVPAASAAIVCFTLPAGFRPGASRLFAITDNIAAGQGSVATNGDFVINSATTVGHTYGVDSVTFLAEA